MCLFCLYACRIDGSSMLFRVFLSSCWNPLFGHCSCLFRQLFLLFHLPCQLPAGRKGWFLWLVMYRLCFSWDQLGRLMWPSSNWKRSKRMLQRRHQSCHWLPFTLHVQFFLTLWLNLAGDDPGDFLAPPLFQEQFDSNWCDNFRRHIHESIAPWSQTLYCAWNVSPSLILEFW